MTKRQYLYTKHFNTWQIMDKYTKIYEQQYQCVMKIMHNNGI